VLTRDAQPGPHATPLTLMRVRSVISEPQAGATVALGARLIRGYAWSGAGAITRVEVSADGGQTWDSAGLTSAPERYAWRAWEYHWPATAPGPVTLLSRAYDDAGNQQPAEAEWNALGYANNGFQTVPVTVS
jgi:molybdenum-dependent oxidoreductase-like protein